LADLITLSNYIREHGEGPLPNPPTETLSPPPYLDVNGDGAITMADMAAVSTYLSSGPPAPAAAGMESVRTDDANNMVQTSASVYDSGASGGDGNLTQITLFIDDDSSNNRVTVFGYDFRNRRVSEDGEIDFYATISYNNLDQAIQSDRRDTSSGGNLIARSQTNFDDRGRVYQTIRFQVNPSTGTVGDQLIDNSFYDANGNVIESLSAASEAWTKTDFDGLGRAIRSMVGYTEDDADKVFQQAETVYDPASNVLQTTQLQRYHDDTTSTGPLVANDNARPQYMAYWQDGIGRTVAQANYGTNEEQPFTRPDTPPQE
jgi:hypothetical protein